METDAGIVGSIQFIEVSKLLLDVNNPRFEVEEHEKNQTALANKLILGYDVLTVAESMSRNGFFANEPLVAIIDDTDASKFIVIEGNRRLTALKALCDPEFRKTLFDPETWTKLSKDSSLTNSTKVPVTVVTDRNKINPILGYRHISGIHGWQPLAQARFIAKMIDDENASFEETANSVGKAKADVVRMYRDQAIVRQAAEAGVDVSRMESSFSLLTLAMSSPALRDFVSAPLGSAIEKGSKPIPQDKAENLVEVCSWLFGDETNSAVISDSREISKLGKVIQKPKGLEILRDTRDLTQAKTAIDDEGMDPLVRLKNRLRAAVNAAESAAEDFAEFADDAQVISLLDELQGKVTALGA